MLVSKCTITSSIFSNLYVVIKRDNIRELIL